MPTAIKRVVASRGPSTLELRSGVLESRWYCIIFTVQDLALTWTLPTVMPSETAAQEWGDASRRSLEGLLQWNSSPKDHTEEITQPKLCSPNPGNWWVNTWLKCEHTLYPGLSVTSVCYYPIDLSVSSSSAPGVCCCTLDCIPRGTPQKVVLVFSTWLLLN